MLLAANEVATDPRGVKVAHQTSGGGEAQKPKVQHRSSLSRTRHWAEMASRWIPV